MRVLTVTNMYPPHHYGGYELSCRDVMRRWQARGHEVTVLTSQMTVPGVVAPDDEDAGTVHRTLDLYWDHHVLVSPPPHRRLAIEQANQHRLRDALVEARPDVVSVWNMGAMSLGLVTTLCATGVPLVYVVCDDWLHYGPRLDAWSRLFVQRPRLGRLVAAVTGVPTLLPDDLGRSGAFCFVSDTTRDRATAGTPWTFEPSTVVYSGIDLAEFPPDLAVTDHPGWHGRLLYVGRIDERKGLDTAVRALVHLPGTTLTILGRGDEGYLADLRRLADGLGVADRLRFDAVPRHSLAEHYRAVDALVFPSTWDEPFGLVPIEAMACGTPVVATGRGGSGEFLADGVNALLFAAGDERALAAAVRRLAESPTLRGALARNGVVTARAFSVDALADTLEAWHLAAADRFRSGLPADRTPPVATG